MEEETTWEVCVGGDNLGGVCGGDNLGGVWRRR